MPASGASPRPWRRFVLVALASWLGLSLAVYVFVAIVDPWDVLPWSPPWQRAPMSHNQRFAYAGLTRNGDFDSLVVGTSTMRLLRPATLNALFDSRFLNLSMNSATTYEQQRLLSVFTRSHRVIRTLVWGVDPMRWCQAGETPAKYMYLTFPEYLYDADTRPAYAHLFTMYGVQEAFAQFAYLVGWRPPRFGHDGYASFLPDDRVYDTAKAATYLGRLDLPHGAIEDTVRDVPSQNFPTHAQLRQTLALLPAGTLKLLVFPPVYLGAQPPPGSDAAKTIAACKYRIVAIAGASANTRVIDFFIDSPITRPATNFWDPLHFRIGFADRFAADMKRALDGNASPDYRVLR